MRVIVSLSGGMDSATVLGEAVEAGGDPSCVIAVGFTYGSKHNPFENACAKKLAEYYQVPFRLIDLSSVMGQFKSSLIKTAGIEVPEGHFEAETMRLTIVPNRNMIFLSILTGIAISEDAQQIWLGAHAGDHYIYPDCRPEFFKTMQTAIALADEKSPTLVLPYLSVTKKEIIQRGLSFKKPVPYEWTRTCYKDSEISCGRCGSCVERRYAWKELGIDDPLQYQDNGVLPESPNKNI